MSIRAKKVNIKLVDLEEDLSWLVNKNVIVIRGQF